MAPDEVTSMADTARVIAFIAIAEHCHVTEVASG